MPTITNGPADPQPITHPIPPPIRPGARTHNLYAACYPANGQISTDQTGRFPVHSTAGNSNMLILYDYNHRNIIHVEAMPSLLSYQILLSYQRAHRLLVFRGLQPCLQKSTTSDRQPSFTTWMIKMWIYNLHPPKSIAAMPPNVLSAHSITTFSPSGAPPTQLNR